MPTPNPMIEEIVEEFEKEYYDFKFVDKITDDYYYQALKSFWKQKLLQLSAAKDAEWQAKMDAEIQKAREEQIKKDVEICNSQIKYPNCWSSDKIKECIFRNDILEKIANIILSRLEPEKK